MTLRIRANAPAINAHTHLLRMDRSLDRSLEHLSSGLRINRAADGPASLVISEQMRSQIAGIQQAIDNTETAVSMVQTAEAALNEVNNLVISLRRLAVHASNEAVNDDYMLQADQNEAENILEAIDDVARNTTFGNRHMLDGSMGHGGVSIGENLEYITAKRNSESSGTEDYDVLISQVARKASIVSGEISPDRIEAGETFVISEGAKSVKLVSEPDMELEQIAELLNQKMERIGMNVTASFIGNNKLSIEHNDYGSGHNFSVTASSDETFATEGGKTLFVDNGEDVQGTIGGFAATGAGQFLTGVKGTPVDGLQLRYTGEKEPKNTDSGDLVGAVSFTQQSKHFQLGEHAGNTALMAIRSMFTHDLARGVENESGYESIADIDLRSFQGAQDALRLIEVITDEIADLRGELGAFQKNRLERNLAHLRVNNEHIVSSQSVIRDADMAETITNYTKNEMMRQTSLAAMAHSNSSISQIVNLIQR